MSEGLFCSFSNLLFCYFVLPLQKKKNTMRFLSYIIAFFTHPIWLPIYGAMVVLFNIPFPLPVEQMKFTWLLLLIVTIAIPTLIYLILFVVGWLQNPFIIPLEKQKWLLYGYIAMLLGVAFGITPIDPYPILYFYVMNLAISCFIILFLHFLRLQVNMFAMGMGALTTFSVLLSIAVEKDMTYIVAFFLFLSGACISAQAYLNQKSLWLMFLSWLIGVLPQLSLLLLFRNLIFAM